MATRSVAPAYRGLLGDLNEAVDTYQRLLEKYPDTERTEEVKTQVKALKKDIKKKKKKEKENKAKRPKLFE